MRLIDCFSPLISFALYSQNHTESPDTGSIEKIYQHFQDFIAESRNRCDANGYSQTQCENALFAVVAWIDEHRLCTTKPADSRWLPYELQKKYFNTSNGGDEFYERFFAIAPEEEELREVFSYCLALGFRGRMYDDPDAFDTFCQQHLNSTAEHIGGSLPPILFTEGYYPEDIEIKRGRNRFRPSSFTLLIVFLSLSVMGGLYLFGYQSLQTLYSSLSTTGL